MKMAAAKQVFLAIYTLAMSLHTGGLVLLWKARKTEMDKVERLILTNLSLTEFLISASHVIEISLSFYGYKYIGFKIANRTLYHSFYFTMIMLTGNRFLKMYRVFNYVTYRASFKTMCLLLLSWSLSLTASLLITFSLKRHYMYSVLDFIFLFIAFATYGYAIYQVYHLNINRGTRNFCERNYKKMLKRKFRGFLLPSLIVLTFVLFICVPDFIFEYSRFIDPKFMTDWLATMCDYLYVIGYCCDALVYIFISPYIRTLISTIVRVRNDRQICREIMRNIQFTSDSFVPTQKLIAV